MRHPSPVLHLVPMEELRPTQLTVGYREVLQKAKAWRMAKGPARSKVLAHHVAPAVVGPKGRYYIVDNHHLIRALHDDGAPGVFVQVLRDLSRLAKSEFWTTLDLHGWVHTYDEEGRRTDFAAIPKRIADLKDDPYRSLAGELRRAGGFAKDATPYAEFLWAEFFRPRIKKSNLVDHFDATFAKAAKMAHDPDADHLPGWCGPKGNVVAQAKDRLEMSIKKTRKLTAAKAIGLLEKKPSV